MNIVDRSSTVTGNDVFPDGLGLMVVRNEATLIPLATTRHELQGGRIVDVRDRLYAAWGDHDDLTSLRKFTTYPGLEPVVRHLLGEGAVLRCQPATILPEPDVVRVAEHGPVDHQLLAATQACRHLLVRYERQHVNLARMIAEIVLAFPGSLVVVCAARRCEARDLVHRLKTRPVDAMLLTSDRCCPDQYPQLCIGTPESLPYAASRLKPQDILIASNAVEAVTQTGRMVIREARPAKIIGLLPHNERVAPREMDLIRCLFGFDEVVVLRHGLESRLVQTVFLPVKGGPRPPSDADAFIAKQDGVWRHPVRNRRLARLARKLAVSDRSTLLHMAREIDAVLPVTDELNLAMVVEGVDQALALLPHLPDLGLACRDLNPRGLSWRQRRLLRQRSQADADAIIYTQSAIRVADLAELDVLISAVGTPGGLAHLAPLAAHPWASSLLLVDFVDQHHPLLRRWSRQRQQAYREVGWYPIGSDPVEERVKDFRAGRPNA